MNFLCPLPPSGNPGHKNRARRGSRTGAFSSVIPEFPQGHAKRRLTFPSFLDQYAYALPLGGGIAFKTDNAPLFDWSLEQFAAL